MVRRGSYKIKFPPRVCPWPLLFLTYINDLWNGIKSTVRLSPDDCIINRKIRNNTDNISLQKDLEEVAKWARVNKMIINVRKTWQWHSVKRTNISKLLYR